MDDDTLSAALAQDVAANARSGAAYSPPDLPPNPLSGASTDVPTGASQAGASRRKGPAPVPVSDLFSTTEMSATQ